MMYSITNNGEKVSVSEHALLLLASIEELEDKNLISHTPKHIDRESQKLSLVTSLGRRFIQAHAGS